MQGAKLPQWWATPGAGNNTRYQIPIGANTMGTPVAGRLLSTNFTSLTLFLDCCGTGRASTERCRQSK
jgi:hypothetical protein